MPKFPLLALAKFSQIDSRYIGNKATQIAELYKLRLPVPETLIIPSKILKDILFFNNLEDKFLEQLDSTDWDNPYSVSASSKLIQKHIKTLEYPRELSKQLISIYHQQFKSDFVAVRLSPLSKTEASLKNAYLNVKGDANLLHSITSIWADHFQESLLETRYKEIKTGQFASTAILLQEMIQGKSAGIAFTGDIKSLGKSIISIYSTWGIADHIDQIQNIDKFFVNFTNQNIILRDIAIKTTEHRRKLDTLKIRKVPKNKQALASLSDKEIDQIAEYTIKAKRKNIDHVALEWTAEKNKVYVLGITKNPTAEKQAKKNKIAPISSPAKKQKTSIKVFSKDSVTSFKYQAIELLSDPNSLREEITRLKKANEKQIILPFVRTVHEYLLLKQNFKNLPVLLEFASPAPLLEIETYLKHDIFGFSLNLNSIDLFLKGINQNQSASQKINNLYTFDTQLMKQLLDRFFEKVHTSKRNVRIQVQLEKLDNDFLEFLLQRKVDSLLVKTEQIQHCKKYLFEIEKELINAKY